jgi:hypothetical protein
MTMAVNNSRSMTQDFNEGTVDASYMHLTPDRVNVENPPVDRLSWPRYANVERWRDSPFLEANIQHAQRPIERKASYGTDPRF